MSVWIDQSVPYHYAEGSSSSVSCCDKRRAFQVRRFVFSRLATVPQRHCATRAPDCLARAHRRRFLGRRRSPRVRGVRARICLSVPIPVIVDADAGYGNPLNFHRTVAELIAAGATGCFLEDQVSPKQCGDMRGKRVIRRNGCSSAS